MGKKRNSDYMFFDSANINKRTYAHYYDYLKSLAISMFEWKNLPETIDERFLEMCLYEKGSAVFFEDEGIGYLALQVMMNGKWNLYNVPINRRAYATNGYHKDLTEKNSVMIFNNMLRKNSVGDMELFARRLYEVDRAIDTNVIAQKTPIAIVADENQRLTLENLYMKYAGNMPFIFADKNLDLKSIQVINTNAPYVADKLTMTKHDIFNEALTYLGISNINTVKKERLIGDEVSRNMGSTIASRYNRLNVRKQACEKINEMFGLDIDVEYRVDIDVFADDIAEQEIDNMEGEKDE